MKGILKVLTLMIILSIGVSTSTSAEEVSQKDKTVPFNVKVSLPSNQVEGVKSYFNLNVEKGKVQELYVLIQNYSSEPIKVGMKSANALNSARGGIEYTDSKFSRLSSLTDERFYLADYIEVPETIALEGYEVRRIPVKVTVPEDAEDTLLGGLIFYDLTDSGDEFVNKEGQVTFKGDIKLNMAIAIQLNLPDKVEQEPLLVGAASTSVYPAGAYVNFELENTNPSIVENASFDYKIQTKNGDTEFEGVIETFNVAPKARVSMEIPWESEYYKQGKYQLVLNGEIVRDFEIIRDHVKSYAENTGQSIRTPFMSIPMYAWGIIILILAILIYLAYRYGKLKRELEVQKELDREERKAS